MKIDTLLAAQAAGWRLDEIGPESLTLACPREGCGVRVTVREGEPLPVCATGEGPGIVLESHEHLRVLLRGARERLGLSIAEVEDAAGLSASHLLKAEKDRPARKVDVDTTIDWAGALGLVLVLVPADLPTKTLRIVADTRHLVESRRHKARLAAEKREAKRRERPVALPPPPPGLPLYRKAAGLVR